MYVICTFIGQMVTARFCSTKCCNQAYKYKRKVESGKYTPIDGNIDLSTISRRVDERKRFKESLKDKQFSLPQRLPNCLAYAEAPSTTIYGTKN